MASRSTADQRRAQRHGVTRRATAVIVLALALVVGAVGCSGSSSKGAAAGSKGKATSGSGPAGTDADSGSGATTTSTTTIPPGGAPSTAPDAGTGPPSASTPGTSPDAGPPPTPAEVALKARVVEQDFPVGFGSSPATGLYAALLPCLLGADGAALPVAQTDGDRYSIGAPDQQVQALTTTAVFPSVDVAKRVFATSSTPQFGQCATGVLTTAGEIDGPSGGPLSRVGGLPSRGDQSVWFRGNLSAADPTGGDVRVPVDALISPIRTGSTVSFLLLLSTGSRVDQWMINDLSQSLADRQR